MFIIINSWFSRVLLVLCGSLVLSGCLEYGFREDRDLQSRSQCIFSVPFASDIEDRVFFSLDSAELSNKARRTLSKQADWLKQNEQYGVIIAGHADGRGTRQYKLGVSARRVNAVVGYLVAVGIPSHRIRSFAYGKECPIGFCSNESCWKKERRVVTILTKLNSVAR